MRPRAAALTQATANKLASEVAARPGAQIVIDLSEIREWDSDGAAVLVNLAEASDRVRITGLAEATSRMLGVTDLQSPATTPPPPPSPEPDPAPAAGSVVRLRATAVFHPASQTELAARLEETVAGLTADVTTFVLDLAALEGLDSAAVDAAAFGSSLAAVRGVRMLVVNVSAGDLDALRKSGLSAQTWVSPPPLP